MNQIKGKCMGDSNPALIPLSSMRNRDPSLRLVRQIVILLGIAAASSRGQSQTYRALSLDQTGQLSITLESGTVESPPKLPDQVSFSQPLLSGDRRTVAWLANYADPSASQGSSQTITGRLVLYSASHVIRSFGTDQVFWSLQFVNQDRDIAFCTGPTHGGATVCELHRIASGHLRAKWDPHSAGDLPPWVKGLTY